MLVHTNLHVTNLYKNRHRLLNQSNKLLNQSLLNFIVKEEIENLGGLKCKIQHMLDMKLLLCFDDFFSWFQKYSFKPIYGIEWFDFLFLFCLIGSKLDEKLVATERRMKYKLINIFSITLNFCWFFFNYCFLIPFEVVVFIRLCHCYKIFSIWVHVDFEMIANLCISICMQTSLLRALFFVPALCFLRMCLWFVQLQVCYLQSFPNVVCCFVHLVVENEISLHSLRK